MPLFRAPRFLRGALIQLSGAMIGSAPNIIVFQYNPESLTRSVKPYDAPDPTAPGPSGGETAAVPPEVETTQPFDPEESFSLQLLFDAADMLERPDENGVAVATGVADRVAALEILLYPRRDGAESGLLRSAGGSVSAGAQPAGVETSTPTDPATGGGTDEPAPRSSVPVLLFVWGPGRIVPVRINNFSVEELQYNTLLYPHRAKVSLGLRVMTSARLNAITDYRNEHELAAFAYDYTLGQKQLLALANLIKTADSLIGGRLPF